MAKKVVRALRTLVNYALIAVLCLPLVMGCYALWDSHMVYERANVDQWQPYKPIEPEPLSFWELQRMNPEVRAWLSVYGTNIDYPVCQAAPGAEDKYLTTNAKGEYSLSGALFMDTANAADFSDFSTIVYGHHMENDVMFGSITDFADKEFFDEHRYGNLFVNDTDYGLEFFCFLDADAYDREVYRHVFAGEGERKDYLALLHGRARHWRDDVQVGSTDCIVLLSTCSSGYTNAREILVGKICHERFENPFVRIPNLGTGVDAQEGWLGVPFWCWLALAVLVILVVIIARTRKATRIMGRRLGHGAQGVLLLVAVLLSLAYAPCLAWASESTATITAKVCVFQEYTVSVSGLQNTFEYVIEPEEATAPLPVDAKGKTFESFTLTREDDMWLEFPVEVAVDPSATPYVYHYMLKPKQTKLTDGLYYVDVLSTSLEAGVNEYALELHVQPANADAAVSVIVPTVHVEEWDGPKVTDPGWRVSYKETEKKQEESSGSAGTQSSTTGSSTGSTSRQSLSRTSDVLPSVDVLICVACAGAVLTIVALRMRGKAGDDNA